MRNRSTRVEHESAPPSRSQHCNSALRIPHSAFGMMRPATYQPPLPLDRLLVPVGAPGAGDRMELDVVIVGAGPAGLACAITLAQLAQQSGGRTELNIGVLEKAEALGEHSLSGAVVNPRAFRELFPDLKDADFPFRAPVTKEAVHLLTAATGLDREGRPLASHQPPNDIVAKVTVLAEGTRGMLAQAYLEWQHRAAENPQIFALGVKEIWETKQPLDRIVHTLGWPLP